MYRKFDLISSKHRICDTCVFEKFFDLSRIIESKVMII